MIFKGWESGKAEKREEGYFLSATSVTNLPGIQVCESGGTDGDHHTDVHLGGSIPTCSQAQGEGFDHAHLLSQNQRQRKREQKCECAVCTSREEKTCGCKHHAARTQAWGYHAVLSSQLPNVTASTFFCTSTRRCSTLILHFQDVRLESLAEKRFREKPAGLSVSRT